MNNPLENILRDQKQKQRTFGITENLLEKPVPRFYGAGDHKVQLAYITPDEAKLLADLDLHNSNPPNPGPEGIPNFNDPGTGMSGSQMSAAERGDVKGSGMSKSEVAGIQAGFNAAAAGQQASQNFMNNQNQNQNQNQNTTTTPTTPQDDKQYTHNFLDALFNKDLSFKFDPKMDYVNRVYGGLNDVQKNRILNRIDPTGNLFGGDFDAFSSMAANDLYSKDNFSFKGLYDNVKDYFTGIPDAIANYKPQMPTQEGLVDLAKNVGYQGFFNPAMAVITGSPFSLFGSIVLGKGPYNLTKEGTYDPSLGDIANLTNAPANYVDAISNYQGGLTPEQMAQVASGMAAKAEEKANTKSGDEPTAEERAALQAQMDAQSTAAYKNTLTEQQLRVYERLEEQGYTDDYIRAYLGFL